VRWGNWRILSLNLISTSPFMNEDAERYTYYFRNGSIDVQSVVSKDGCTCRTLSIYFW